MARALSHYKPRLLLVLILTGLMAGTTSLYPVVIDHAFQMFADRDRRILYQIPALVLAITSIKAAAQYFQNVQVQQIVLLVIRDLQGRMFAHLARADLARLEREAPAQLAARFTTDATIIRDLLTRAVNGVADAVTVVGLVASMLYLDWLLSLVAAAMYPLAAVPIQNIGKRIRRASGGMQESNMLNEATNSTIVIGERLRVTAWWSAGQCGASLGRRRARADSAPARSGRSRARAGARSCRRRAVVQQQPRAGAVRRLDRVVQRVVVVRLGAVLEQQLDGRIAARARDREIRPLLAGRALRVGTALEQLACRCHRVGGDPARAT